MTKKGKEPETVEKTTVCIICREKLKPSELKRAKKVKEDKLIKTIRSIKQGLNIASNNKLYVCEKHVEEHKKKRKEFEKGLIFTAIMGIIIFLGLVLLPIFTSGNINFVSMLLGIFIAVMLTALHGFIKYTPAVEG